MKLTKGEFSLFNFSSQKSLISEKGITIASRKIEKMKEIRIYLIYDFYVEVVFNNLKNEIEKIHLNINGIPELYYD